MSATNHSPSTLSAKVRPIAVALAVALALPPATALADPPPWAPAHGYREKGKNKDKKKGRDDHYERHLPSPAWQGFYGLPLGLEQGRCDRGLVGANLGTVLGAVAGGLAGSQIGKGDGRLAATIGGTLLGAALGNALANSMAPADQGCMAQALERAPTGQTIVWDSPDANGRYAITPVRTFEPEPGRFCREYSSRATIGGRVQEVTGTACRQPDGAWQIMN